MLSGVKTTIKRAKNIFALFMAVRVNKKNPENSHIMILKGEIINESRCKLQ
jgi:hypothetical protein